jgi:hypothetical protein
MNKEFGSQLLISETVSRAASYIIDQAISKGKVQVSGREAGIRVYQLA